MYRRSLLFCFAIVVLIGCKKEEKHYSQTYSIRYYPYSDSFVAYANLAIGYKTLPLPSKESITFDGQPAHSINNGVYVWSGTGRGKFDASFILKKEQRTLVNSIALSKVPDFQLVCPDTVYKSKNLIVRVKNYVPDPTHVNLHFGNDRRDAGSIVKGDSVVFGASFLKEFENGPARVRFNEWFKEPLQNSDNNLGEHIRYDIVLEKAVWLTD
ncbi:MAG: hypothetical protein R2800_08255 [Flavipsychrobacter sp.]